MEIAIIFYSLTEGDNLSSKPIVPSKTHKMSHQNIIFNIPLSCDRKHFLWGRHDVIIEDVGEL